MNKRKIIYIFIIIYLLSIGGIQTTYKKVVDLNSNIGCDKMVVRLKGGNISNSLNKSKVEDVKRIIGNELITYYTFQNLDIQSEFNNENVRVYGIGGDFKEFYKMDIKGSFLTKDSQIYKERVIVLDDKTANKLFGSEEVIGLDIEINGQTFKIIGIVSIENSIADKITGNDMNVFIPLSVMEDLNINNLQEKLEIPITNMEISMKHINVYQLRDQIKSLGIDTRNFIIQDFKLEGLKTVQRRKLLIFFVSFIFIFKLIKRLFQIINIIIDKIKDCLEFDYFWDVITKKWRIYIIDLIKSILIVLSIIFLWQISTFELYINPERIPSDPTSLHQIMSIFKDILNDFFTNKDNIYMFSVYKRSLNFITLSKICLVTGSFSLLYYFRHKGRKDTGEFYLSSQ